MSKKKIMRCFKISEISAVDRPAQGGARLAIMKRDSEDIEKEQPRDENGRWVEGSGGGSSRKTPGSSWGSRTKEKGPVTVTIGRTTFVRTGKTSTMVTSGKRVFEMEASDDSVSPIWVDGKGNKIRSVRKSDPIEFSPELDVLKRLKLTSSVEGHSHLINDTEEGGETSWIKAEGAEYGHSHPWVKNDDGSITIGEAEGHSHDVLDTTFKSIHSEEGDGGTGDGTNSNTAESLGSNTKESPMTEKTAAAEIEALKSDLAVAKAYGSLTDAEKTHYTSLSDEDKKSFLAKSADQRKDDVAKAASSDPVVYKSAEGVEYRKSDDPRLVALAKSADENSKIAKAEREQRENAEFAKRANEELKHLPGEEAPKVALLKAVESISDADTRAKVKEMLKANNDKMAKAFETKGANGGTAEGTSSQDQLDTLAKKYSADHKVTFEKAMAEVLNTSEGRELYNSISSK